jgi:elongation factor P
MATTNDIKNGSVLNLDGQLWAVVEFQHVKPGKGGAFVRTKLKNVRSAKVVDKTFNAGTKIDFATVDRRDYTFLYEEALYVDLPASVTLLITYSEPGLQGDRSTGGTKPATLETGYEIQVPLFVEQGTTVKVDTRTGEYLGRVADE